MKTRQPVWPLRPSGAILTGAHVVRRLPRRFPMPRPVPLPVRRAIFRRRQADLAPAPAGRPRREDAPRATAPHQTWQMDACEHLRLLQGEACWLRLIDEYTGAVLLTVVFPPGLLGQGAGGGGAGSLATGV